MTGPCETCQQPGEFCGLGGVAVDAVKCVRCGTPTKVRSRCGAARTAVCRQPTARRSTATTLGPSESFTAWLMARGDLDYAGVRRAEQLWRDHMKGIEWRGPAGTALAILEGALHYKGIPALPPANLDALETVKRDGVWGARAWLHTPGELPAGTELELTSWDVNGMYLSAAAIELGTGDPDLIRDPEPSALKLPGWVRVAELHNAPWSIASRWKPGMWMPTALMDYARERGALVVMPQALVWPTHRRWLDPHVNLMRTARKALVSFPDTDKAAAAALDAVKAVYTRMFGGLLGAKDKYNPGLTNRPDWRAAVVGTAQARMFRALDNLTSGTVIGFHVDAAWIVVPAGERPGGLTVSTDLGKFKPTGRCTWTSELADLHADREHESIRKVLAGER